MQNETCSELRLSSEGRKEVKVEVGLGYNGKTNRAKKEDLQDSERIASKEGSPLLIGDPTVLQRPSAGPN